MNYESLRFAIEGKVARIVLARPDAENRVDARMLRELAAHLDLNLSEKDIAIHYPNIFPKTWSMVTRYLQLPRVEQITDGMRDRAHCGATDSVISLGKVHRGQRGRLHVVVNYGVGLHLGVCILEEHRPNGADG